MFVVLDGDYFVGSMGVSVLQKIIIASVVIIVAWLLLLRSDRVSTRVKKFVTGLVIISPIPPIP